MLLISSYMILYFVPETGHAALVLVDEGNAVGGRVGSLREEHALVALRLLVLADAAGLWEKKMSACKFGGREKTPRGAHLGLRSLGRSRSRSSRRWGL